MFLYQLKLGHWKQSLWLSSVWRAPSSPRCRAGRGIGGYRRRWARLYGSGKGIAIAAAARRHRGPCLVIVANAAEAGRIADEVQFFGGDGLEPLAFPDWETLPHDRFSPHQDIVSERLATL